MAQVRVLIVEDDPDQRELICEALEDYFGPGCAASAADGRSALDQAGGRFDLILLDYNLPDGSGIEWLEQIRRRCATPVVMVTGENVGPIAVQAVRAGAADYIVKTGDYLLTIPLVVEKNLMAARMVAENQSLHRQLQEMLREVQDKNARLEELAATDPLTGLYNRRHFGRVLEQLFAAASRTEEDLSCIMIDLDGYKQVNDQLGHQVGDELLVIAARVITANLRQMDIAARYGGDEFILLLPSAHLEQARSAAARISSEFQLASARLLGRPEGLTMSIGIATAAESRPAGPERLIAAADAALYRAKNNGRDCIVTAGQ